MPTRASPSDIEARIPQAILDRRNGIPEDLWNDIQNLIHAHVETEFELYTYEKILTVYEYVIFGLVAFSGFIGFKYWTK
jgi:hypothetical protein